MKKERTKKVDAASASSSTSEADGVNDMTTKLATIHGVAGRPTCMLLKLGNNTQNNSSTPIESRYADSYSSTIDPILDAGFFPEGEVAGAVCVSLSSRRVLTKEPGRLPRFSVLAK